MAKKSKPIPESKITASDVQVLLRQRHTEDVYVSECKLGGTYVHASQRMDGWALKSSWAHPLITGYEIKVSRADFLQDTKWPNYLPTCNAFYFVCPKGVIQPEECPEQAGLLYVASTQKLYVKKKAPYREVEMQAAFDVMRYILMSRSKICESTFKSRKTESGWQAWLQQKEEDRATGWLVRQEMSRITKGEIDRIKKENADLRSRDKTLDEVQQFLNTLGVTYPSQYRVKEALINNLGGIRRDLEDAARGLERTVAGMRRRLDYLKQEEDRYWEQLQVGPEEERD